MKIQTNRNSPGEDYVVVRTEIKVSLAGAYSTASVSPETKVTCPATPEGRQKAAEQAAKINLDLISAELPKALRKTIRLYEKYRNDNS